MSAAGSYAGAATAGLPAKSRLRVAFVLWNGSIGGAEVFTGELVRAMRRAGVDARVLFVASPYPLADQLDRSGVPYATMSLERGRDVLRAPRVLAGRVTQLGPDGVVTPERGFLGAALRIGGYRSRIVGVEHGALLQRPRTYMRVISDIADQLLGAWADDVEVGVSDFVLRRIRMGPHAPASRRIYNGIDPDRFSASVPGDVARQDVPVVGIASRLVPGKGVDALLRAFRNVLETTPARLRVAGEGEERARLQTLAGDLAIAEQVEFWGFVADMPAFWRGCDVAVCPSQAFEAFGMTALEAMSCSLPVVATRNGALPELVGDGISGTLVDVGDLEGMATALDRYLRSSDLRRSHGAAGRALALTRFHIDTAAHEYIECLHGAEPTSRAGQRSRFPLRLRRMSV